MTLRILSLTAIACLLAAACTATTSGRHEASPAAAEAARRVFLSCTLRHTTRLDDGRSEASTVGAAVRHACRREAFGWVQVLSRGHGPFYRQGLVKGLTDLSYYTRFVLSYRASRRGR